MPIGTARELADRLGPLPLHRLVADPLPGSATIEDATRHHEAGETFEFVDGVLIRKPMSDRIARLTGRLFEAVSAVVEPLDRGVVAGTNVLLQLTTQSLRIANVVYVDTPRPEGHSPGSREPILCEQSPSLAIEVLGPDHTGEEMEAKLHDYFVVGTRLVWYVYPKSKQVHVYTSLESVAMLQETDTLDGGEILPGFSLPLADLFGG